MATGKLPLQFFKVCGHLPIVARWRELLIFSQVRLDLAAIRFLGASVPTPQIKVLDRVWQAIKKLTVQNLLPFVLVDSSRESEGKK